MNDNYDRVKQQFLDYLSQDGVSEATLKFYASDLNHFERWLLTKLADLGSVASNLTEAFPYLSPSTAQEYKNSLNSASNPIATINRRLSTLRRFSVFLSESGYLTYDFAQNLTNISASKLKHINTTSASARHAVAEFERHLLAKKKSANTVRNYIADVKQFLEWLEAKYEPATT